jgi:hypothetical protein
LASRYAAVARPPARAATTVGTGQVSVKGMEGL